MKRLTKALPTECKRCQGIGYTAKEGTETRVINERLTTVYQGSGCVNCLGTGQVHANSHMS